MYYMKYTTTVTSKGTVTIAAPLRKALGIKPGQKLSLDITSDNRLVIDAGTDMNAFQAKRSAITNKIPEHLKGLSGEALQRAASKAWLSGFND
jgi:AbrB family looped-hinge helix DNA binding protein